MKKLVLLFIVIALLASKGIAQNQPLYGLASLGGPSGEGTLFKVNQNGTGFSVLHNFQSPAGFYPMGNLLQASDGNLYGSCHEGGMYASCTIFKYNPVTSNYTDVYDFDITNGDFPKSGLIEGPAGKLYGVASSGGVTGNGVIYSYDMNTNTYTPEYSFGSGNNGSLPYGSPILVGSMLYGMTSSNIINGSGILYSYDISSKTFSELFIFGGSYGKSPMGSLLSANNGKLYGMTKDGGANNYGIIFSYDLSNGIFTNLYDFDSVNGANPWGGLTESSSGILYGMTYQGGNDNSGVIFSFNLSGNIYSKLFDFSPIVSGTGTLPQGNLMVDNAGVLYGMTSSGGGREVELLLPLTHLITHLQNFLILILRPWAQILMEVSFWA